MESGEDFMLEVSTDGGNSFSTIKSWASGTDFTNNVRFSVNERITNHDFIYLDDVLIENCSGGVISCTLEGQLCDDGDPCTQGETYDSDCNCNGGIFMDQDEDGYCAAEDPNDNDPASSVLVSFSVIAVSMEPGEDFMLEVSTDGGNNFSTIKSWARTMTSSILTMYL